MALSKFIAACGFDCRDCPAYKATHSKDLEEQKRMAEKWSKAVGKPMTIDEIKCDGCRAGGRLVAYCASCNIKTCAQNKGYPTCAHCPDMPCGKIVQRKTQDMLVKLKKELGI
jgi:hypothetical protein